MRFNEIQAALQSRKFDAWLFYDHHHRDPIAYRVLGLPESMFVTRRWFYLVPAEGEPQKLVHRIEAGHLDSLPGSKREYSSYQELGANLKAMVTQVSSRFASLSVREPGAPKGGAPSVRRRIAMQYSPQNMVPYIGLVDAGTVELVRSFGVEVVSSGDLVALFEAVWTPEQIESHFAAGRIIDRVTEEAFKEIGRRVRNGGTHEFEIRQWIDEALTREGLTNENDPPIVAVNAHSGNPHYGPSAERSAPIREGDFVLLDIWGKLTRPDSVYYDITWTGFVGKAPGDRIREIFQIVTSARDVGVKTVQDAASAGRRLCGWEVDKAVRDYIEGSGYGRYFVHRTGHSIATTVHGNGANMDNLETKDEREILANSCFSVEPGIYLPEFGVRSEVDLLVRERSAEVTGRIQREIVII